MGFYSEVLFPWGMNLSMSGEEFQKQRQVALQPAQGNILEIGFGSGLNLPHYPNSVKKLACVDPNAGMARYTQKQIDNSNIIVTQYVLSGESLPMLDETFDTVVSTWTLCSISNIEKALLEIKRVLKPGGCFIFLEHGLSPNEQVCRWQHRLNGIQKIIGDGCHLNRDIRKLIGSTGFKKIEVDNFYFPKIPRLLGYMYRGIAIK